jgi:hypothetical protein
LEDTGRLGHRGADKALIISSGNFEAGLRAGFFVVILRGLFCYASIQVYLEALWLKITWI